ncbi:MAG: isochorismatase transposase [Herbaspirillum sp.]|jgi:ureidoacrylate peracid hydrolase|nr:isochorismatase transposase [Herbaspirillum sp.]
MHNYVIPDSVKERVLRRKGKAISIDAFDTARTALVVIDMQNHFVAPGFPAEVPPARDIVPNINRIAKAVRDAGGTVIWVQTTANGALEYWGNHHKYGLRPEGVKRRLDSLAEHAEGFKLYPALEPADGDLRVKKIMFSALIPHSSNLRQQLTQRKIDTLLIVGTTTNVCCESTARDAMMLDYRVAMLSDACATRHDEEHAASLNNFQSFFGDVMTIDEAIARLPVGG